MQGVKWLFFDVGSTLVDESDVYRMRFQGIADQAGVSIEEVMEKAFAYYRKGEKGDKETAAYYDVGLPRWDTSLEKAFPDAAECLEKLSKRYKIGVIANQIIGTAERLEGYGLLKFIDVVVASAEEGVAKPDRLIFEIALERSRCSAENAVMIGDRMDNDIIPAHDIGMKTVLIKQGFAKTDERSYHISPDHIVNSLTELTKIFLSQEE